jgi:hypothetical protein
MTSFFLKKNNDFFPMPHGISVSKTESCDCDCQSHIIVLIIMSALAIR